MGSQTSHGAGICFLILIAVQSTHAISREKFSSREQNVELNIDDKIQLGNGQNWEKEILKRGSSRSLKQASGEGAGFGPSTSSSGCKCLSPWYASGDKFDGTCDNPVNDRLGVFCYVNETTCAQTPYSIRAQSSSEGVFDYCNPSTGRTSSGCECEHSWGFGGSQYLGTCANPTDETTGWCFVNEETCDNPPKGTLQGFKWDYCAGGEEPEEYIPPETDGTITIAGCQCAQQWSYDRNQFYNGSCANPDGDRGGNWCYVDGRTCESTPFAKGRVGAWDFCTPSPDSTISGCKCRRRWDLFAATLGSGYSGICANPDNDPRGNWCIVDSDSCNEPAFGPVGSQQGLEYDYCADTVEEPMSEFIAEIDDEEDEENIEVDTTINGCKCRPGASFMDTFETFTFNGSCANPDLDAAGTWCIVDAKTCKMEPQGEFVIDQTLGILNYWDYCEPPLAPPTLAGCTCEKRWSFPPGSASEAEYFGVCDNPDNDVQGNWCVVNEKSCTRGQPAGRLRASLNIFYSIFGLIDSPFFDYCPPGAPTMEDFRALMPEGARLEAPGAPLRPPVVEESPVVETPFFPLPPAESPPPFASLPSRPIPSPIQRPVETFAPSLVTPIVEEGCKTVVQRLSDTAQLSSLFSAVEATGLTNILDDDQVQATVFAPTNDAFQNFYTAAGYATLEEFISAEEESLRNVILYHIIANQRLDSSSLSGELFTLFNQAPIIATRNPTTGLQLLGGQSSSASVLLTDVIACNSVVHLIDTVLDVPLP